MRGMLVYTNSFSLSPSLSLPSIGFPNRGDILVRPKLHNINPHNVTHSLISQNPREQMFIVQISLLIVTFLYLYITEFVINANHQRNQPTPLHCAMCYMWSVAFLFLFFLCHLSECWCMRPPHCPRRPRGVDHTSVGDGRTDSIVLTSPLCYSIISHDTLIL